MVKPKLPPLDTRPFFTKMILPVTLSDLAIPPEIIEQQYLLRKKTDMMITVTLRGPRRESSIKLILQKNGKNTYFDEEDWEIFLRQQSIAKYEFLMFKYNGNMSFDVKVCGVNGCLKSFSGSRGQSTSKKPSLSSVPLAAITSSSSSSSSSTPSFEVIMKSSNISSNSTLVIPRNFVQKHLGGCNRSTMTLKNLKGVSWLVSVAPFCTKYACFSRGWKAFADANNLKKGNVCVFKLVEENVMEVQII